MAAFAQAAGTTDTFSWTVPRPDPNDKNGWFAVFDAKIVRTTEKALLVEIPPAKEGGLVLQVWVPRSQLHPIENDCTQVGVPGVLVIPMWLAKEKRIA